LWIYWWKNWRKNSAKYILLCAWCYLVAFCNCLFSNKPIGIVQPINGEKINTVSSFGTRCHINFHRWPKRLHFWGLISIQHAIINIMTWYFRALFFFQMKISFRADLGNNHCYLVAFHNFVFSCKLFSFIQPFNENNTTWCYFYVRCTIFLVLLVFFKKKINENITLHICAYLVVCVLRSVNAISLLQV